MQSPFMVSANTTPGPDGGLTRLPHGPPFVFIDRLLSATDDTAVAEKLVTGNDAWLKGGMPELLVVEALAQTAACMVDQRRGAHRGLLVAAAGFTFGERAQVGDRVTLRVRRGAQLGALLRVHGEALVGERRLTAGELTFAIEDE